MHLLVYVYIDNFEIAIIIRLLRLLSLSVCCILAHCRNYNFKFGYLVLLGRVDLAMAMVAEQSALEWSVSCVVISILTLSRGTLRPNWHRTPRGDRCGVAVTKMSTRRQTRARVTAAASTVNIFAAQVILLLKTLLLFHSSSGHFLDIWFKGYLICLLMYLLCLRKGLEAMCWKPDLQLSEGRIITDSSTSSS